MTDYTSEFEIVNDYEQWLIHRRMERYFAFANGLNNDDPETNGEYLCIDFFLEKGFSSFLDIGANKGIFTKRILENFPKIKVHAFEPNPIHRDDFITLENTVDNLKFHNFAIGAERGKFDFYRHPILHETSSLSKRALMTKKFQSQMDRIEVEVCSLDECNLPNNNLFIKIDTEGHEFPVIKGGSGLITSAKRIIILFEYSFGWKEAGQNIDSCFQYLNKAGFTFYRVLPIGLEELRFITTDMASIQYCNYVAAKGIEFENKRIIEVPSPYGKNKLIRLDI